MDGWYLTAIGVLVCGCVCLFMAKTTKSGPDAWGAEIIGYVAACILSAIGALIAAVHWFLS
jgi:hypothetical protein